MLNEKAFGRQPVKTYAARALALAVGLSVCVPAISHQQNQGDLSNGVVQFDSSCGEKSRDALNRGVARLHNMMYLEAEKIFSEAAAADDTCAMLHWGVAMTRFHPLWPGRPSSEDLQVGSQAIGTAQKIGGGDQRENAYIAAAAGFYNGADTPWGERLKTWSAGQKNIMEQFPDDRDAIALYALSHLSTADKSDKSLTNQREAGELLEKLNRDFPDHPAGFHYLIHAYDNPALAAEATGVAGAYDKLAPDVPHALHMPTHIFTRMGMWDQSIDWNHRSADAALAQSDRDVTTSHYAHAIDYLVYAYLQRGNIEAAGAALAEMEAIGNHQNSFAAAYALAASPARIPLETEDWEKAASIPLNENESISWEKYPAMSSITEFARGIGAARSGSAGLSAKSIAALETFRNRLIEQDQGYWATLVHSQQKAVEAWKLYAEGDEKQALTMMAEAADLEDSVDKHPVTPGAVLPARELLGDMLALAGNNADALKAYDQALLISPNRSRSLKGAWLSATATGKDDLARSYKSQLDSLLDSEAAGQ